MKKLALILSFVLFSSSVFAGSCPMMAKNLDAKIAEAQELRDAGMKAHDSGDPVSYTHLRAHETN